MLAGAGSGSPPIVISGRYLIETWSRPLSTHATDASVQFEHERW
jgi:hypothetical protein